MMVFLDTEFTDFKDPQLISLGMVTEFDQEFYIEVPYPTFHCSSFVNQVVIPLLGKETESFCATEKLQPKLLSWLKSQRLGSGAVQICIDYDTDWDLFCAALNNQIPSWCKKKNVWSNIDNLLVESYFAKTGLPQHHALYDARANRYAYLSKVT